MWTYIVDINFDLSFSHNTESEAGFLGSALYSSFHSHGSAKWVPPRLVSLKLVYFSTSMIAGERVASHLSRKLPHNLRLPCGQKKNTQLRFPHPTNSHHLSNPSCNMIPLEWRPTASHLFLRSSVNPTSKGEWNVIMFHQATPLKN